MKWTETITPKQAAEELGVPYHGWMREMDRAWISEDQKYSVMSRLLRTEWGKVEHVTITAAEGVGRSDGAGREHSIKELLEENGAADVPKQAYAQAMAGYMMKNLLGG